MLFRVQQQAKLCKVHRLIWNADKWWKKAVRNSDNINMDLMHDALDRYKDARNLIHEVDPEIRKASFHYHPDKKIYNFKFGDD